MFNAAVSQMVFNDMHELVKNVWRQLAVGIIQPVNPRLNHLQGIKILGIKYSVAPQKVCPIAIR